METHGEYCKDITMRETKRMGYGPDRETIPSLFALISEVRGAVSTYERRWNIVSRIC